MRNDCTIDDQFVIARNASTLAGGRVRVKRGDAFTFKDSHGGESIARSLGRVSAPSLGADYPHSAVSGFILAMVASADFTFAFERWINPDNVTRVFDSPANMARFFFTPSIPYPPETMRALIEHGTIAERYISNHASRVAEMNAAKASRDATTGVESLAALSFESLCALATQASELIDASTNESQRVFNRATFESIFAQIKTRAEFDAATIDSLVRFSEN